jgi:hypothetical protein
MSASRPREKQAAPGEGPVAAAVPVSGLFEAGPGSGTRTPRRRGAVEVQAREGGEIVDLQEWVRRYVTIVMETDAARRAGDASGGAAPPSALPKRSD